MKKEDLSQQIKEFVGRKIAEFRLERGMSQEQLAKLIDKAGSTAISYFESGLRKVSIADLIKIAKVLDKSVDDFLPKTATEQVENKEYALKLRANYNKLDKVTEESIIEFTKFAKNKFKK